MSDVIKDLPLGIQNFHELREDDFFYVDKTSLIYELVKTKKGFYFLSRPRRFGKTLLLSTFASLFKYGLRDFKGLAIEKLWTDEKTYPVINIDLSLYNRFSDLTDFRQRFELVINKALDGTGEVLPVAENSSDHVPSRFDRVISNFVKKGLSPVLLIDEYDAPVNYCLNNKELFTQISNELADFYAVIKNQSSNFRFIFITGICKHNTLDLFSSGNFIQDISFSTDYGSLAGYTVQEVEKYFGPYIENAAKILNLSVDECFAKMRRYYDGFCFEMYGKQHVFSPWSVLNFLAKPRDGFRNYWYNSAGLPTVLEQYIKEHSLKKPEEYGQDRVLGVDDLTNYRGLNGEFCDTVMLYQTGYLSIKSAFVEDMTVTLNYPNSEVSESMAKLYTEMVLGNRTVTSVIGYGPVGLFGTKSPDDVVASLNKLFLSVDYKDYPVKNEATLRAYIQLYLKVGGINPLVETHNAKGRSDLEFKVKDRYWVIELKFAKEQDSPQKLLNEAVAQLKSRQYGEQNENELQHLRLALVFSQKDRQFVEFDVI